MNEISNLRSRRLIREKVGCGRFNSAKSQVDTRAPHTVVGRNRR